MGSEQELLKTDFEQQLLKMHPTELLTHTVDIRTFFSEKIKKIIKLRNKLRIQSLTPKFVDEELLVIDPSKFSIDPCDNDIEKKETNDALEDELKRHIELLKLINKMSTCPISQKIDKL